MRKRTGRWAVAAALLVGAVLVGIGSVERAESPPPRVLPAAVEATPADSANERNSTPGSGAVSAEEATLPQSGDLVAASSSSGEGGDPAGRAEAPSKSNSAPWERVTARLGQPTIPDLAELERRVSSQQSALLAEGINVVGLVKRVGEVPPPLRVEVSPGCVGAAPQVREVSVDGGEVTERKVWRDLRGVVEVERLRSSAGGVAEALVYLDGDALGSGASPPPESPIELRIRACRLVPTMVAARTGQPLRVVNDTPNLFTFDLYASIEKHRVVLPGKAFEWRPPLVREIAELRNDTEPALPPSWLAVFDHPFFAVTTQEGLFALGPVPPGDHPIILFHPTLGEQRTTISVRPNQVTPVLFLAGPAPR